MVQEPDRMAASIVSFCRYARASGLPVGTPQTIAALEASNAVGVADWQRFRVALRAVLCCSPEEWKQFDELFRSFWSSATNQMQASSRKSQLAADSVTQTPSARSEKLFAMAKEDAIAGDGQGKMVLGASSQQRLRKVDFSEMPRSDLPALERLSLRLLRQMSLRLSRRLKINSRADRVDVRRSIRQNISHGGDLISLAYQGRRPFKKKLVILLDISGSMNLYSLFLMRFAYALQKHFKRVNTFLFSTTVVQVTDALKARKLSHTLAELSQTTIEWSGGTKIGGSLAELNRRFSRSVLTPNTVFIILSDGWDTGAPELLAAELRSIRRRVQKLLWLNPLLGLKEYQPVTRGMKAALPYVDIFAPAHNLESLLALERYL
jgi:hypothetical protein